ncbi:MAG: hypothetical protein ACI7YS_10665 [Flavobacterium sp.]
MNKIDLLYGVLIGFLGAILGVYLFLELFTSYDFTYGIETLKSQGYLGNLIAMGGVFNIGIFFLLLRFNKDLMARGIVLATIILTVITLFLQYQ